MNQEAGYTSVDLQVLLLKEKEAFLKKDFLTAWPRFVSVCFLKLSVVKGLRDFADLYAA